MYMQSKQPPRLIAETLKLMQMQSLKSYLSLNFEMSISFQKLFLYS